MAGLIPLGVIVDPSKDPFPSTGPHLDPRIIPRFGARKGQRINPEEARSLLQNVLVGPDRIPIVQQAGQEWKWNFPITSRYGPRSAPAPGASTFHQGIDLAIPTGTQLTYTGYGTYRPDNGFGVLSTTDAQGNPYDIEFLHTVPGKAASVGSSVAPEAPQLPPPENQPSQQTSSDAEEKFLREYMAEYMNQQMQQGIALQMLQKKRKDPFAEFQEFMQMANMGGGVANPLLS